VYDRRRIIGRILAAGAATHMLIYSAGAQDSAQETQEQLDRLENRIRESENLRDTATRRAEDAAQMAEKLGSELVDVGKRLRRAEENVRNIEQRINSLTSEESNLRQSLKSQEANLAQLLGIMERLKRRPAITALMQPDDAVSTARSVVLIRSVIPQIDAKAANLRRTLTTLAKVEAELGEERFALSTSRNRLAEQQSDLSRLVDRRRREARKQFARAESESRRLRQLAGQAEDLRELLDAVISVTPAMRPTPPKRRTAPAPSAPRPRTDISTRALSKNFARNKGLLSYPVVGTEVLSFGQLDGVVSSRGTRLETAPKAQVYAPFDGEIAFAGAFRRFGLVLIIAHGQGYHSLLAGMDQIYGAEGDRILTGEPIGTMGDASRTFTKSGATTMQRPELYLELRRNGDAIDPAPWFRNQLAAAGR